MTGLVLHVQLVLDRVNLLARIRLDRVFDVPLHYLAVEEQRGVSVAFAIKGRVQRAKAQFRFGHHDRAGIGIAGENGVKLGHVDHRHRRGKLAADAQVFFVRRHVATVRVVGDRDVAGVVLVLALAAVQHLDAAHFLEIAGGDALFDLGDVEHHDMVHVRGGHIGEGHAHFRVIRGRERPFSLVVGIGVVKVARHLNLPRHRHLVSVHRGEDVHVCRGIGHRRAVVDQGRLILAIAEDVVGARPLLRAHAVDRLGVGDFKDLVALHHVAAHAGDAGVGLVVHEQVAAVVIAFGHRHVNVMKVAVVMHLLAIGFEKLLGLVGHVFLHDAQRFIGLAPAGGRAAVEHRNPHQLAHRRNAQYPHLAGLARRPETIILVQLPRRDGPRRIGGGLRRRCACDSRKPCEAAGQCQTPAAKSAGQCGPACRCAQKAAAADP